MAESLWESKACEKKEAAAAVQNYITENGKERLIINMKSYEKQKKPEQ